MALRARRLRPAPDMWPGFVDVLSTLLIIILFMLMVFTLAQFFLSQLLSGRNEALDKLNRQVTELSDMLSIERRSNTDLRHDIGQLSAELQSATAARDSLTTQAAELAARADAAEAEKQKALGGLEDANKLVAADKEKVELQLRTIESLRRDISALSKVRKELEDKVTQLAAASEDRTEQLTAARDRSKQLEAALSTEKERTALSQKAIDDKDVRLAHLTSKLKESGEVGNAARDQVDILSRQVQALRQELARIASALDASEIKSKQQQVQIVNLGQRLNSALVSKVEELSRYRSEFFGKLRQALGNRQDIRIVGDRFVFQSEVLFPSATAELTDNGQQQIARVAGVLKEISGEIPKDVNWILQVNGYTDQRPIHNAQFPSNWELSTARAVAVVKRLIELGVPPDRLAAAGYGEFQPIDPHNNEDAWRRNRRIEFKLTNK